MEELEVQNQNQEKEVNKDSKGTKRKKKKNKVYTKRMELRLTDEQEKMLSQNCKKWGLDKSQYIRITCCTTEDTRKKLNRQEIKEDLNELRRDLRRMGNNINQIATKLHTNQEFSKVGIFKKKYVEPYDELMKKFMEILEDR